MDEKIYTIPINLSFEQLSGCPLCRLYEEAKSKALDYVTGAAMMEPSVRIMTNEQGFCREHFSDMLAMKNRLSVALMLESHMDEIGKRLYAHGGKNASKEAGRIAGSCFVCSRIEEYMSHYLSNIVHMFRSGLEFRELYSRQEGFCIPHTAALLAAGAEGLSKKEFPDFQRLTLEAAKRSHDALREDLAGFTRSFDYRFQAEPKTERVKSAVENTVAYLASVKK